MLPSGSLSSAHAADVAVEMQDEPGGAHRVRGCWSRLFVGAHGSTVVRPAAPWVAIGPPSGAWFWSCHCSRARCACRPQHHVDGPVTGPDRGMPGVAAEVSYFRRSHLGRAHPSDPFPCRAHRGGPSAGTGTSHRPTHKGVSEHMRREVVKHQSRLGHRRRRDPRGMVCRVKNGMMVLRGQRSWRMRRHIVAVIS